MSLVVTALVLIGLAALQGIVDSLTAARVESSSLALLFAVNSAVLLVLLIGMAIRMRWARWTFVVISAAGLGSRFGGLDVLAPLGDAGFAVTRALGLAPGYVQAALQTIAAVLLLLPPSAKWFRRQEPPAAVKV
jgi:hypothetical protein